MDKSCKGHQGNGLSFLTRDIIFVILLNLPPEFLWTCARRVCRAWADIISNPDFVNALFLKSKDVLLVKESMEPHYTRVLEREAGRFKPEVMRSKFVFPGMPSNSCRGLCIFSRSDPSDRDLVRMYVANPMTGQIKQLPSLGRGRCICYMAYIDQTMEYKAVCIFSSGSTFNSTFKLFTYSLGVNVSWRKLDHLPETIFEGFSGPTSLARILELFSSLTVVCIGEYLYVLQENATIARINLREESVHYIQFPHGMMQKNFGLQKRGDYISCIFNQGDHLDVWMLRVTEWVRVCKIKDDRVRKNLCNCSWSPIGWLDNCLILAARSRLRLWTYDADSEETKDFSLDAEFCWRFSVIHRNCLVKW